MLSWVEKEAQEQAQFLRDGPELWRNFRLAADVAVECFNRCYCQPFAPEFAFGDCLEVTNTCFRVRNLPRPGEAERFIECRFKLEGRRIIVSQDPTPAKLAVGGFKFAKAAPEAKFSLFFLAGPEPQESAEEVSIEEACKLLLRPFLFPDGPRTPINPPQL
jgi:hypothetical protein